MKQFLILVAMLIAVDANAQFLPHRRKHFGDTTVAFTDPTSISSLVLWLKADSTASGKGPKTSGDVAATNGQAVATWYDESGQANSLTQTNASYTPILTTNVQNGKAAVNWSTSDDYMRNTNLSHVLNTNGCTIFVCLREHSSLANFRTVLDDDDGDASGRVALLADNAAPNHYGMYAGSTFNSTIVITNAMNVVMTYVVNGASSKIRRNGSVATESTGSAGANTMNGLTLGASYTPSLNFRGYIFEVIIYNAVLTPTNQSDVENYLNGRWACY